VAEASWEFVAALLQSAFTPAFPGSAPGEHRMVILVGLVMILGFWTMFGPPLEDLLGRKGFAILFVSGLGAGVGVAGIPVFGATEAFWLGHAAALVAMGFCYPVFVFSDVRLNYFYWFPLIAGGQGRWEVPAILFLVPMHLMLMLTQIDLWYGGEHVYDVLVRKGPVNALGWQLLLPMVGAGAGLLYLKLRGGAGTPRESKPAPTWGA
jgi:hypothetical protein